MPILWYFITLLSGLTSVTSFWPRRDDQKPHVDLSGTVFKKLKQLRWRPSVFSVLSPVAWDACVKQGLKQPFWPRVNIAIVYFTIEEVDLSSWMRWECLFQPWEVPPVLIYFSVAKVCIQSLTATLVTKMAKLSFIYNGVLSVFLFFHSRIPLPCDV